MMKKEFLDALQVINSTISNCEKMHPKFEVGTSQHTLLKNRIKALYIAKSLLTNDEIVTYSNKELVEALPPIASIISKCEKGRSKFIEGTSHYTRFQKIINAMTISKTLLVDELNKRGEKF